MSRLSDTRISHLAHLILAGLKEERLVEFASESRALAETKYVLQEFFGQEERLDDLVRQKILSLSRPIPPGSREWDILYRKYLEEETRKQKRK
jgi:hypothetical protein